MSRYPLIERPLDINGCILRNRIVRAAHGTLLAFPNGSKLVANAYWSLMRVPTMATNEALMTKIDLSYAAEPVRYSA